MVMRDKDVSSFRVNRSFDTDVFLAVYGEDISGITRDIDVYPTPETDNSIDFVISCIEQSDRFNHTDDEILRIEQELIFFEKSNNINFIIKIINLINKFKENGVVWGVGRGSSCASYVLYLLHVHDVNSMLYDIPFSELSKGEFNE